MLIDLGLLLACAELTAPAGDPPFRVLLRPLGGDLLSLNHARHWGLKIDGRTLFTASVRRGRETYDNNQRNHCRMGPLYQERPTFLKINEHTVNGGSDVTRSELSNST